jgi:Uma2 family endonuclease
MAETETLAEKKVWTEEELQSLPSDDYKYEVVDGELVISPKNNFQHENICARLLFALEAFNRAHVLGVVLGSNAGYWMKNRNCRAPDVSFIPKERLIQLRFKFSTRKFFPGAPDLAVEVLSPSNTRTEINERLKDFFANGTQIAWVIDAENEGAEICHSTTKRELVGPGAVLEGEQLLPGFRYSLNELFKERDWE